jgi:UDP-glucose 4-epimerase
MNILVTGAAGYIGSIAVEKLKEKGYNVVVVDNLSIGRESHLEAGVPFIKEDVGNKEAMTRILTDNKIDVLMHFAAFALVGESVSDPDKYFQNNIIGTLNLLSAMQQAGCRKIIFSSTCATYGIPQKLPLTETHPINPINSYGFSKRVIEQSLEWCAQAYGFKYNIFRYFNAAGATTRHGEDRDIETHIIPILLETALGKREKFTIFGDDYNTPDGSCIRDYIHVSDIAEAHILGIANLEKHSRSIYNLGTGKGYSNLQVVRMVKEVTGVDFKVEFGARRPGDPDELVADPAKAREELGWVAKDSDLKAIVQSAFNFTRELLGK